MSSGVVVDDHVVRPSSRIVVVVVVVKVWGPWDGESGDEGVRAELGVACLEV